MDTGIIIAIIGGTSAAIGGLAALIIAPSRAWKLLAESLENRVARLEKSIERLETGIRQRDDAIAQRDGVIRRLRTALHHANGELFKVGLKAMIVEPGSVIEHADEIVPDLSRPEGFFDDVSK